MQKVPMQRLNINLSKDMLDKLNAVCEELGCPRSSYIAMALKQKFQSDEVMSKFPEMMSSMSEMIALAKSMKDNEALLTESVYDPE